MTGDLFGTPEPEIVPGRKLAARLEAVLIADGDGFATRPVDRFDLTLEGIAGDHHAGHVRRAGGREPWYPRGTAIRSGRQVSIVSAEDLAEVAAALGLAAVPPEAIGANMVLSGVARLSFLPAGSRLFLAGGAALVVEAQNAPCRDAGAALARALGRPELETAFAKAAARRRGLVASVERAGAAEAGTAVSVRVPAQWIWR
ncbi:putative metal-sulfur cluster biosynthesis proteins YuaD [Pleomorphomonas sp. SM30]|uniref:MOSC domain-containing protein n=1 Tax=Oharaeibacter diazotrophicus TaxID=1920512 RepID=A0A4R6R9U1_9HYPH|nr:hypothetical protein EDD54_3974 [Oharaeibacter diazotrophicus]BBE72534.1 putative metal-sulfur cluster biosynthesis proteins YuaD [Pleomorphomonas sp. SM30]